MMAGFPATTMSSTPRVTVLVAASPAGIAAAADGLARFQADCGLDREAGWPVYVALDEILSNIVRHGGGQGREPLIEVSFAIAAAGLEVTIADDGPEFDPLGLPEPDLTPPIEERQPGGLGVHLVRRLMDRVEYARREERNYLVITYRARPSSPPGLGRE
jgi:anti-sigma regulatory factor (Ser/Thr protein kinase)